MSLCSALLVVVVVAVPAQAQDTGALQRSIDSKQTREKSLGSAASRLAALERRASRDATALRERLNARQAELDAAAGRLARTRAELRTERRHLAGLRSRLREGRATLSRLLVHRYMTTRPGLIDVVLGAHGFKELLERFEFLDRVKDNDASVLYAVRHARNSSRTTERELARLEPRRQRETAAVKRRRDALAALHGVLERRRAVIAQAHAARVIALRATRAGRRRAERTLKRLIARQQRAAVSMVGPGGPWAIPYAIVQCESGGQNLPPNFAGASGYYQFMPATWKGLGGSTPNAYQAPKAEQDRLAARLWDGGRGARNWVCAGIVGIA